MTSIREKCSTKNARISSTQLTHAPMTAWINLEFDGAAQGFGGHYLVGPAMANFIKGVMSALEADSWEDLQGMHCRAFGDSGKIWSIGHIIKDKWFDLEKFMQELEDD